MRIDRIASMSSIDVCGIYNTLTVLKLFSSESHRGEILPEATGKKCLHHECQIVRDTLLKLINTLLLTIVSFLIAQVLQSPCR